MTNHRPISLLVLHADVHGVVDNTLCALCPGLMPKVMGRQRIKRARSAREDSSIYTYVYIYICMHVCRYGRVYIYIYVCLYLSVQCICLIHV